MVNLAKTYRIETDRLIIRCYEPADASKLLDAITISIDHIRPWMPWAKDEPTDLETKINLLRKFRGQFDLGEDYVFGVFDKSEKEIIGSTGLHTRLGNDVREIGYWINVKHINNGFATEVVSALTKVGFEIEKLSRIEIDMIPENVRSQNIPKKTGIQIGAGIKKQGIRKYCKSNRHDGMVNE